MCGITGIVGASPERLAQIGPAIGYLAHRGPDAADVWAAADEGVALGHARLAIIDLSDNGRQPMHSPDRRYVMVFNGEIYNYQELRRDLEARGETFTGSSDSEVLLRLYALEGARCFERLNGIFAAAFWDRQERELCLVRDALGVKPLYFARTASGLCFASELKTLLRTGWVRPTLNPAAVMRHLGLLWSPGEETLVQEVSKLLPGQLLTWREAAAPTFSRFGQLGFGPKRRGDGVEAVASDVANAVRTAVRRQLVADVPVGAFLSGGLDSSSIVAFARQELGARIPCFSIALTGGAGASEGFADDLPFARRVAKHLDVDLHVVTAGEDIMDHLATMIYHLDEPTPDPAAIHTLLISRLARSHGMKVLLSGSGGDDIFTGYRRHAAIAHEHFWNWLPASVRGALGDGSGLVSKRNPLARRAAKLFQYGNLEGDERIASYFLWMDPERCHRLLSPDFRRATEPGQILSRMVRTLAEGPPIADPLDRMLFLELNHFLADHNLNYADKMGMATGVEIRVPLLDRDLVDLACRLPVDLKQKGMTGKWIFRKAMEPHLPHDVIYRPKTGFGVPLRRWLSGPLRGLLDDTLSPAALQRRGIFDPAEVARLRRDDAGGVVDASYSIFGMACIELWCRQFLDGHHADAAPGRVAVEEAVA